MDQIIITHLDGTTLKLQSKTNVSKITRATQSVELLGNDIVDITVESATKLNFYIGDKITIIGRDYTLNTPAKERKISEAHFTYDLQFEGVQYDLLRPTYSVNVDTTNNQIQDLNGDSLTGDLKRFLDVLISNANRVFPGKWSLGTYPANTETRTETFSETDNCLSVLQSLCSEDKFNTEFSIVIDGSGNRTINVGATGTNHAYTFEYGKGKGIYELTRQKVSSSNIITRLNVFGSSKNINTLKYRAYKLCLPGKTKSQSYIENSAAIAKYGAWEATKTFEDVFPHRTGTISSLGDSELKFIDSSMDFDLNEKEADGITTKYLIPGTSAKIRFNTGNLAGYEFEVTEYNNVTKQFTLIAQTDENGYTFPSPTSQAFQFAIGDKYVIVDIYMPQTYVTNAEDELQTKGTAFLAKYCQPLVGYGLSVDSFFLRDIVNANPETNIFWAGDYIPIKDADLEVDKAIRVKGFTRDLLKDYSYNLTIADLPIQVSTISRVISELNGIDKVVRMNNLADPAKARRNYLSAQEILNMVFDPEGDFYSDKIKPLSIDTTMLSVGAKSMQFGLEGTILQPNYGGAKNRVVYTGGVLTHYAILDASNNPRVWNITDDDINLGTDAAYYIYAKCQRVGSGASILFSANKIIVDSDGAYLHFLIGVINSVDSNNARALALMYGFTTVNGRFIKTGRITSNDGTKYFDLDTGEFKGTFKFTSGETIQDAITNSVNAIQVGGRNLVLNSAALAFYYNNVGTGISVLNTSEEEAFYRATPDSNKAVSITGANVYFESDKEYISSIFVRQNSGSIVTVTINNYLALTNGQKSYDLVSGVWTKIETGASLGNNTGSFLFLSLGNVSISLDYKKVKREIGNKATDWTPAPEDVDAKINENKNYVDAIKADLQNQIDGNITSWFFDYEPNLTNVPASNWSQDGVKEIHLGDLFYWTSKGFVYRFQKVGSVFSWTRITDTDVTKALADAAKAQDTADNKRRVFVVQPTTPYEIGDLWSQGSSGDIMRCVNTRLTGSFVIGDWEKGSKYTDDTAAAAAQQRAVEAETAAKAYAEAQAELAETIAKTYADDIVTAEEQRAINDATDKANAARSEAISAAAVDATSKVNAIQVGGRNLMLNSASLQYIATSPGYGNSVLMTDESEKYYRSTPDVGKIVSMYNPILTKILTPTKNYIYSIYVRQNSGSPQTCFLYRQTDYSRSETTVNSGVWVQIASLPITGVDQIVTFLGCNTPDVALDYKMTKVEIGNKATDWTPAPEDVDAKIAETDYLKTAMQGSTEITGGLVATNVLLIKDSEGATKGGMSGLSTDNVGVWTGGTYADAIASLAKNILFKNGSFRLAGGDVVYDIDQLALTISALIRTAASGERVEISKESNSITIYDSNNVAKMKFAPKNVMSFADIGGNVATITTTYSAHSNSLDDAGSVNIGSNETLVLDSTKYYDVTTPAVNYEINAYGYYDGQTKVNYVGSASVVARLVDTIKGTVVWSRAKSVSSGTSTGDFDAGEIAGSTVVALSGSTYRFEVYLYVSLEGASTGYAYAAIASGRTLTGTTMANFSEMGLNGFNFINDNTHYLHYGPDVFAYKGAMDFPGVLATGSVASGATHTAKWGAKVATSGQAVNHIGTGVYNIPHNLGSTEFTVNLTPTTDNINCRITGKTTTYFQVTCRNMSGTAVDASFDYTMYGSN